MLRFCIEGRLEVVPVGAKMAVWRCIFYWVLVVVREGWAVATVCSMRPVKCNDSPNSNEGDFQNCPLMCGRSEIEC